MENNIDDDLLGKGTPVSQGTAVLPNATGALVLGIISLATCWLYGVPGIVCGIIAIVLYRKDKPLYEADRTRYQQSYNNLMAGFVCGIIGLIISSLFFIYMIFFFVAMGTRGFSRF